MRGQVVGVCLLLLCSNRYHSLLSHLSDPNRRFQEVCQKILYGFCNVTFKVCYTC